MKVAAKADLLPLIHKELQGVPFERGTTLMLCTGQSFQYIFLVHIAN